MNGIPVSGGRFKVYYRLFGHGSEASALAAARDIALEQTVEFPEEHIPSEAIRKNIVGRIESVTGEGGIFEATISYAAETAGGQVPQLLNVLFGNSSLKPDILLSRIELPENMPFKGPRFGVEGLRRLLGIPDRPLLCTAIKPLGLNARELADLTYRFALGGIDIIKDDHGLADQPFAPFKERVELCSAAVAKANKETGGRSLYFPSITLPFNDFPGMLRFAKQAGAGGFLVSPGIVGFDAMRLIAGNDELNLPVLMHPTFLGGFVTHQAGISHMALFGQLARIAGADGSIFPNYGGRFAFSREQCAGIAAGCSMPMGSLKRIFPVPGGGMTLDRVSEMLELYGRDVIFLIGGGLFNRGPDVTAAARYFLSLVEKSPQTSSAAK
jgi:ribulose-bisphosphate carboxylase large chain